CPGVGPARLRAGSLDGVGDGGQLMARTDRPGHDGERPAPPEFIDESPHVRPLSARLNPLRPRLAGRPFLAPAEVLDFSAGSELASLQMASGRPFSGRK